MNIIYNYFFRIRKLNKFNNTKSILVYTNIIFIITIIIVLNCKKNIKIKDYISSIIIFLIALFSSKFHNCQCYSNKEKLILKWQKIDTIWSLIVILIFSMIYFRNINVYVLFLSGIAMFLWLIPPSNNHKLYIICHSLWHIMIGIICLLLMIND